MIDTVLSHRGRHGDAVQLRPCVLPGRHAGAQRLRAVPAHADAAQAARRDLQRRRPAQAGQEQLLPRPAGPPAPQQRPVPHRPGRQGHGDARLRPAVVPLCLQADQGLLPGPEAHHARTDQGQVPAGEAARPRRPHGRHAGIQQGGPATGALRARADRRDAEVLPEHAGDHRWQRPAGNHHRPRLHRATDDPAEPVPEGRNGRRGHRRDRARHDRLRQRHQGPGGRQHLPRRHAVEELRHDAPGQGGVLRLRRDRVPQRLQLPARAAADRTTTSRGPTGSGSTSARRTSSPRPSAPSCWATPGCARPS